ncbi:MAG: polysaccharide biosynthesis protein [Clostridia bacterium]|nr:polysaccharide biosynthesis protein [Clostridia bacterium]
MKIGFIASSGGHWEELMCLREIADEHDAFYITEAGGQANDSKLNNIYTVNQINRKEKTFLYKFIKLFITAIKVIRKERPDVVITTGALIAFPFCLIAKLSGAKVICIETFARVTNKSITGRLIYPFADLFLVQWESMLECYPKAKYIGNIF